MNKKERFSVISLFSGCGGIDLGFKQAGFNIVWANEKNKNACESYRLNFPETKMLEKDIRYVKDSEFPRNSDVLFGGYPCQGFSLGGNRRLNDERNLLYKEFGRCLEIIKPKIFLAENVKGLATMENGLVLDIMIQDFAEKDYTVEYKHYNAKEFGVSQDRERIFLVGTRNDLELDFQFPEAKYGPGLKPYKTLKDTIWDLRSKQGEYYEGDYSPRFISRQRKRGWNEVSYCITASIKQNPLHPAGKKMKKVEKDKFIFQGKENRTLSFLECMVIQSFPKDYKLKGSLTSKYRQIGNAVPPLMVKPIAQEIKNTLKKYYERYQELKSFKSNSEGKMIKV